MSGPTVLRGRTVVKDADYTPSKTDHQSCRVASRTQPKAR